MSISPLVINYSFAQNRTSAQDKVDLVQLNAIFNQIAAKQNEIITALAVTTRADDTLADGVVTPATLSTETQEYIIAVAQNPTNPPVI
jgi:hypothetical protein